MNEFTQVQTHLLALNQTGIKKERSAKVILCGMKSAITVSHVSHGKTKQVAEHSDSYKCDQPQIHRLHLPSFNFWWWHAHMSNIPVTVTKIPHAEASNWTAARTHERSQHVSFHSLLSQFTSFLGPSRFAGWPLFSWQKFLILTSFGWWNEQCRGQLRD